MTDYNQSPYILGRKCEGPSEQSHFHLDELKYIASILNIPQTGNKYTLCQRIREYLNHYPEAIDLLPAKITRLEPKNKTWITKPKPQVRESKPQVLETKSQVVESDLDQALAKLKISESRPYQTDLRCRFIVRSSERGVGIDIQAYQQFFQNSYVADRKTNDREMVDINFYIEMPFDSYIDQARINLVMPNYEYLIYEPTRLTTLKLLEKMDLVICKTLITADYCQKLKNRYGFNYQIVYTRHTTIVTNVTKMVGIKPDHSTWLHAAGRSQWKQTDAVLSAWVRHPEWPQLVVTCRDECIQNRYLRGIPYLRARNIRVIEFAPDLAILQYQIRNHICPSIVEGYGHYLNEARAYGCFIITADYPPMNELITPASGVLINCTQKTPKPKSPDVLLCIISTEDLERGVDQALKIPVEQRVKMGQIAYQDYLTDTEFFIQQMSWTLQGIEESIDK